MKSNNTSMLKKQVMMIAITSLFVFIGFKYFLPLFFPFLFAYLIMKLILPIVRFLKRKLHIPVIIGSILALLVTFGVLGGVIGYIGCILVSQIQGFLKNVPIYSQLVTTNLSRICGRCDHMFGLEEGCAALYLSENMNSFWGIIQEVTLPAISEHTMNLFLGIVGVFTLLFIVVLAVINMIVDYDEIRENYLNSEFYKAVSPVTGKLSHVGIAYVKTQATIMLVNAVILILGFHFIGSEYAWLAGIGIAFMDAFPVVGSGLFLVPLAIIKLLGKSYLASAILITMYGLCEFIRSLIEPRLLGGRIGLKPIFTFIAMYVGVQLFGVTGFLLGPLALVIIKTILEESGYFKKQENEGETLS